MDVTTVPSTTAAAAQASVSLDGISGEDFMMILIKQLQYQDPFEPMTNEEMGKLTKGMNIPGMPGLM